MPTNENEELISGTTYEYTIDPNAQNLTVQFSLRYADGTEIFDADNNNVSNNIQQLSYNFEQAPTPPVEDTLYSYGLERVRDRYTTNGTVAMIGDSTMDSQAFGNANNRASRMFAQALITWEPNAWKGTTVPFGGTGSENIQMGPFTFGYSGSRGTNSSSGVPGFNDIFDNIDPGYTPSNAAYWTFDPTDTSNAYLYRAIFSPYGAGIVDTTQDPEYSLEGQASGKEATGITSPWLLNNEKYRYTAMYAVASDALTTGETVITDIDLAFNMGSGAGAAIYSWGPATSSAVDSTLITNTLTYNTRSIEATLTKDPNGDVSTVSSTGGPLVNILPAAANWGDYGASTAFLPVTGFIERPDVAEGLTIIDFATSGFKLPQHRYEPAEQNPETANNDSSAFLGYSDASIEAYYRQFNIDTVHIMSGINDSGLTASDAASYKANVEAVIQRHKNAHAAAGLTSELKFLLISAPEWAPTQTRRDKMGTYPAQLRAIAQADSDVAFLDMYEYWKNTYGDYTAYEADQLIDGVHQSLEYGGVIASKIFDFIKNGDNEDQNPTPPAPTETVLATMEKLEDSATSLTTLSTWWMPNSAYTTTNNLAIGATANPVNTNTSQYPRLITQAGNAIQVNIGFISEAIRDQWVATPEGSECVCRLTIDNNGDQWQAISPTLAELEASLGGTDDSRDPTQTGGFVMKMEIAQDQWTKNGQAITDVNERPNVNNGVFGVNLGWDVDMGVKVELVDLGGA